MRAQRYGMQWDEETGLLVERATSAGGYANIEAYPNHMGYAIDISLGAH